MLCKLFAFAAARCRKLLGCSPCQNATVPKTPMPAKARKPEIRCEASPEPGAGGGAGSALGFAGNLTFSIVLGVFGDSGTVCSWLWGLICVVSHGFPSKQKAYNTSHSLQR